MTEKHGTCTECGHNRAILHRRFAENGAEAFVWKCAKCNKANPFGQKALWISPELVKAHLSAEAIELLPILMPALYGRCTRCGARGAELHHWAPKAIFGLDECEQWPKDYLCKSCHDQWHRLVTPNLVDQ